MSANDMIRYVDSCMAEYGYSLKTLVLTGGECMIYKDAVVDAIKHATGLGLSTRIVTNAFWAASSDEAAGTIRELADAGLKEINFSTGDEHSQWVPLRNIAYATIAAIDQGFHPIINIETHNTSHITTLDFLNQDERLPGLLLANKLEIRNGIWMEFSQNKKVTCRESSVTHRANRCRNLFSIIPINPYGEIFACCGLACEQNPYLRLGNINSESVSVIYERAFEDMLKIWLFTDGPESILKSIDNDKNNLNIDKYRNRHICDLCRILFRDKSNISWLKKNYREQIGRVILKYKLLTYKNE